MKKVKKSQKVTTKDEGDENPVFEYAATEDDRAMLLKSDALPSGTAAERAWTSFACAAIAGRLTFNALGAAEAADSMLAEWRRRWGPE